MSWTSKQTFQADGKANGSYAGRYVHYGIREHAMAAIANGFAAYHPNMIIPITSTFFMFYLWAAPSVRMGALQRLQVIHVATHDSIGTGEDGPTHQPIELANLFRAMPNVLYIRPGDSEETAGAWTVAIKAKNTPSIISTSRHALPQLAPLTKRASVAKGAYVLRENAEATLTLIGVGAELSLAVQVADQLEKSGQAKVRVISFPCQRLFDGQDIEYKRSVLQRRADRPIVVIEPYTPNGWERYANAAFCMTTSRFGQSLPGAVAYQYFGFTADKICDKLVGYMETVKQQPEAIHEFYEFTEADDVASVRIH